MNGKELFCLLCQEVGVDAKEIGRFEVQVKANGQLWITARAGGKPSDRYYDWALWGSDGWKRSIKALKTQEVRG